MKDDHLHLYLKCVYDKNGEATLFVNWPGLKIECPRNGGVASDFLIRNAF